MTERKDQNDLRRVLEQEFSARGIGGDDIIDSFAISQLYVGSYMLSMDEIRDLVREVGRAKGAIVS